MQFRPLHDRVLVHGQLRSRGSSLFDWVMLALSVLTVSWIVVAF